jgi:magnesium transporter
VNEEMRWRLQELRRVLREEKAALAGELLHDVHPADIAIMVRYLDPQEKLRTLKQLPRDRAAEVLAEADEGTRSEILEILPVEQISRLLVKLDADDAVDIVAELPDRQRVEILDLLPREESREMAGLLRYDPHSAGGLMDPDVVSVDQQAMSAEAIEAIRASGDKAREITQVCVVDNFQNLLGLVPVQALLLASPVEPVTALMERNFERIPVDMDQEEVAHLFRRYNLVEAPVVNAEGKLAGRITVEDVLDVMDAEAAEDVSRMAGTGGDEFHESSVFRISRLRLPWLLVGLVGEFIAANVLGHHEQALRTLVSLAFFVPLVAAMAGSAATQASIVVVRGLATGEVDISRVRRKLFLEFRVALVNGFVCGTLVASAATLWRGNPRLGAVVGLAMFCAMMLSTVLGATIPMIFRRIDLDPALATGPFVTTSNDILSLLIYFTLATSLLHWIG